MTKVPPSGGQNGYIYENIIQPFLVSTRKGKKKLASGTSFKRKSICSKEAGKLVSLKQYPPWQLFRKLLLIQYVRLAFLQRGRN